MSYTSVLSLIRNELGTRLGEMRGRVTVGLVMQRDDVFILPQYSGWLCRH
jgi:hypothetical protein